jgi:hypothetical protein
MVASSQWASCIVLRNCDKRQGGTALLTASCPLIWVWDGLRRSTSHTGHETRPLQDRLGHHNIQHTDCQPNPSASAEHDYHQLAGFCGGCRLSPKGGRVYNHRFGARTPFQIR